MFVAENFIRSLVSKYGKHTVYTDGGTGYTQACNFMHLKHRLHSPLEKSLIERMMQYLRIEQNVLMIIILALKNKL